MPKKTPLQIVKDLHGSKEKLVEKLMSLVERGEESKEALQNRLQSASNTKLLRLYDVLTTVKERFGTKSKLVAEILSLMKRIKDKDYSEKLTKFSHAKLLDIYRTWNKKAKAA